MNTDCSRVRTPTSTSIRDWLRTHRDDRDLYARTKQPLADGRLDDIRVYTNAKDVIIDEIYGRALPHYLGSD